MHEPSTPQDHKSLLSWYRENRRDLPWRRDRDPYRIWVSEVMLQQTTVSAVIPFYERFLSLFPDVHALAAASEGTVLKAWSGLGYYSRARNLMKASKALSQTGFPRKAAELAELPGFGPYTAAAVASIAFDDPSGVLDGNVIRILCRRYGWDLEWWTSAARKKLQGQADAFAREGSPSEINQAMMELGATVCTPKSPACLLCPWAKTCIARKDARVSELPRPRPRKDLELWIYSPVVKIKKNKVALVRNDTGPFMKGQHLFPGTFKRVSTGPKNFDARHGVTHHDIFVRIAKDGNIVGEDLRWVDLADVAAVNPSNLLRKVLAAVGKKS